MSLKKKTLKKAISMVTALTTIVWLSGVSMFAISMNVASAAIADGALISSNATNSDGTPTLASLDVYIVKLVGSKKFKRLILNPQVFNSYQHFNWNSVQEVAQSVVDSYTTSNLIRVDADPAEKVYGLAPDGDTGAKSWINLTATQFLTEGGADADSVYVINSTDAGNYTAVADIASVTQLTTFLVSGTLPSTTPVPAGGLSVSLSASTPAAGTVPSKATGVVFTKLNFTASNEGAATLTALTVKRSGVGATTDISHLYLYDGATRLTTGKTVSASTNEAIFTNLNVSIAAGATKTLSVVADIGTAKTGQHAFGVASAAAVTSSATVSGSFPVTGNAMQLSATPTGTADVEATSTTYTRKVGETNVEVGNFSVYVSSTEDAHFKGITLYNSSRDVLSNMKIYRGSTLVASAEKSGSNFVATLDTPYAIAKGQSAIFTIKADVSGRDGDQSILYVRYNTDVVITGDTYGYNLGIDNTLGGDANSYIEEADATKLTNVTTLDAGQLTVTTSGPAAANVSKNSSNIVLMNFTMTAQSTIDISKTTIALTTANVDFATDVENLDLVIDGVVVGTTATAAASNVFTDTYTLIGGKVTTGQIVIDVTNSAAGNETIQASLTDLTSTTNFLAKTSDGDTVTDIIPSGNITGKVMTVTSASLTLDRASSPASAQTYVEGTSDAAIAGFAFKAGNAADVKVTSIKLTAYNDADQNSFADAADKNASSGAKNVMSAIGIYDGSTLITAKKILTVGASDITVTFDGLNLSIPKGTTKTIVAKADLSTAADNENVALTIAAAGDVVSEYGTGTNLGPTLSTNNNTPTVYQIVASAGTLTMASDSNTPSANLVVAGSTGVEYTKFKLTTTREAFVVTKLEIKDSASASDSNFNNIVLSYKDATGAAKTATGTFVVGIADFSFAAGDEIYVGKDTSAVVTIKADLNTISGGAASGTASHVDADFNTNFEAKGVSSGTTVTAAAGADGIGASMTLYESKPTVAFASDTPSGSLIPSANTLAGKLNITATGGKDITFAAGDSIAFTINTSTAGDMNGTNLVAKDKNGNTLCTVAIGSLVGTCDFATNTLTVSAGTTETISIYLNTSALSTGGESVQLSLSDAANANFTWSIDGGASHYATGTMTLRGTLYGGSLVKPGT